MNDPLDELLDARFREETRYIDDAGFTNRVLQQLPDSPSAVRNHRSLVIFLSAVVSVIVAYFASGEGFFVRETLLRAGTLSPLTVIVTAAVTGLVMTTFALWAALDRTRDPLL